MKIDMPAPDWPIARFPALRYPLEDYVSENTAEEHSCLAEVEERIDAWNRKEMPVAAVVVEPIQAEGGDNHATAAFFQGLRDITKKVSGRINHSNIIVYIIKKEMNVCHIDEIRVF